MNPPLPALRPPEHISFFRFAEKTNVRPGRYGIEMSTRFLKDEVMKAKAEQKHARRVMAVSSFQMFLLHVRLWVLC